MAKKKLQNIFVKTVPNGYVLMVYNKEYMAFNEEQLINIFFAHVAIGKKEFLDQDMAAAIIEAAATWKEKGDALEAVATWMTTARKAMKKEQAATRGMVNANLRAEQLEDQIADLKKENDDLRAELAKLKSLSKMLVGGGHKDIIIEEPKSKPDYKIRRVDFDDKPVKRRGRKPKIEAKTTTKKKATKK